jgi:succinate-semialdehyde dehydrogenase/glutarate-semialdehyde dehydrogenase
MDRAVRAAAAAQTVWRGVSFEERGRALLRLADLVRRDADAIATLVAREQGKPRTEAMALEVLPALDHLRFLAEHAERLTTSSDIHPRQPLFAHKRAHYLYDPFGVVALITPYNLPFSRPLIQTAAALVMGNGVVLKPSELTPLCGELVSSLAAEAALPPGLVSVVHAQREDALFLVAHPQVEKIFFTGTRDNARMILAATGGSPRPLVLSTGGKHPAVVAADADLDRAARGIVWGALANAGQGCGSVERVYVDQTVAARFVERVVALVDRVKVGDPLDPDTEMGPLVSEARRQEVHAQVVEAMRRGAHRIRGGTIPDGPGYYYPPTVLLDPPADCRLMREETLGPVIALVVVANAEQGILMANDCDLALTASGWTTSAACADRLLVGLHAGVVTINDVLYSYGEPAATWSGYKASGAGHAHGLTGLREMCRLKFASFDAAPLEAPLFAFPYDAPARGMARAAIDALHATGRLRRIRAVLRLVGSRRFRNRVPLRSFLPAWKRPPKT